MSLRIGSLFSGFGGLDIAAAELFGATVAWHVEFDPAPSKILAHHWPDVPNYGDVTKVDWSTVEPVDIITGGSPCQDLSAAGRRAGMTEGTRSNLWVHMREAIATIRPRYVIWENVLGALSATAASASYLEPGNGPLGNPGDGHLRALGRVLGDLAEIGYDARWTTLRASDIGAPHHRARVFLLATPADSEGGRRDHGSTTHHRSTDREVNAPRDDHNSAAERGRAVSADTDSIGRGHERQPGAGMPEESAPVGDLGSLPGDGRAEPVLVLPTPVAQPSGNSPENHLRKKPGSKKVTDLAILVENGLIETGGVVLPTPNASDGTGGGQHPSQRVGHSRQLIDHALEADTPAWGKYEPAIRRWEQIVGTAPAPTEPNKNGRPRLNAAFAEWMMGLPAEWVTSPDIGISRADQLKAIGNGVCPQQAAAAIRQLLAMA